MTKPSGEGAALLKAICDNPEEDTPRLVYADWLDEQGGDSNVARAEFIRLQIAELAKGEEFLNSRSWTKREHELYLPHYLTWKAELLIYPGVNISSGNEHGNGYERGFVWRVYAKSVRSFLKAAPDLFTQVPITEIRFETITSKTAAELARSPWLERIRTLDQLNGIDDSALQALAPSPYLGNITKLVLSGLSLTDVGMLPLLANPTLTKLTEFHSHRNWRVGKNSLMALMQCASAPILEVVYLPSNGLREVGTLLPALLRLPKLRRLNLHDNSIGDEGAIAAAGTTATPGLHIGMWHNKITDRGGEALLSGPLLQTPRIYIALGGNQLSDSMKAKLKEAFGDRVGVSGSDAAVTSKLTWPSSSDG